MVRSTAPCGIGAGSHPGLGVDPQAQRTTGCDHHDVAPTWGRAPDRVGRGVGIATAGASLATIVVCVAFDVRLAAIGRSDLRMVDGTGVVYLAALTVATLVGTSLLLRHPRHPVGWCFALLAVSLVLAAVTLSYSTYGLRARPGSLPGAATAGVIADGVFILWFVAIGLICAVTPDGRHLSPRWRRASQVMAATGLLWLALRLVAPGPLEAPFQTADNPWGIDGFELRGLRLLLAATNHVLVVAAVVSLAVRFRRAHGDARRQLLWVVVAALPLAALVPLAFVAATTGHDALLDVAAAGIVVVLPVGAGLAVSRYRLYDVDRILSRAASYLVVSMLMAATYALVVVLVARAVGETAGRAPVAIVAATLAVVTAVRPVHAAVQDGIDRRFSRRRYDALRRVRTYVADPAQQGIEQVLREALRDPDLRIAYPVAGTDEWVTEDGEATTAGPDDLRVVRRGRTVAAVSHRGDRRTAEALLDVAAPELANAGLRAAIAVQLQEVRASRHRIARAQVEERRRVERDLHDGAQQRLLGAAAQLQAALLNGDPGRMRSALELGLAECRTAVVELRELANGLHPSTLSDGGLAAALEDLSNRFSVAEVVEVPAGRYAPDVESALWFVTCEALTNAIKHARPSSVEVRLVEVDHCLHLAIDDDGRGGADPSGSGLSGLVDRIEAVGGRLRVGPRAGGGTSVEAVVPCAS
jgi:signal transduction histidine kinase